VNWLKFSLVILLYLLGIFFTFNWQPWKAIFSYNGLPLIFLLVTIAIFSFTKSHGTKWLLAILDMPAKYWIAFCSLTAFLTATFLTYVPLEGIPHVPDDICYVWQARTFAQGKLFIDSHAIPEFFHVMFFVNDGKWYSLFQPGWPALMALMVPFGLEFLLNPMLAGVAVALVYPIGVRVFSERITRFAMLLMALSPMHVALSAAQISHILTIVLTEIAILMVFKLEEENKLKYALILGFVIGWLFITRALNSIAVMAIVPIPLLYFVIKGKISIYKLMAAAPVAMLFLLLQLGYNHAITGDAFYWPQDRYFDITEPKQGCHSLGFGTKVGCPVIHPGEDYPDGFTVWDAFGVLHKRMGTFLLTLFGWQALFLFIGVPFLSRKYGWRKYFLLSVFLSLLTAYFFWYFHGFWGRYYYESCFAIFLLVSAGMSETNRLLCKLADNKGAVLAKIMRSAIPALAFSYMVFNSFFFIPTATYQILSKSFFNVDSRIEKFSHEIPEKSIIFMDDWYQTCFIFMRPGDTSNKLCAKDLGKHNTQLMQYYPDWHYFKYNVKQDKLSKMNVKVDPTPVFIEPEFKIPAHDTYGGYAHLEDWLTNKNSKASGGSILAFDAKGEGSFVAFQQYIFKDGNYKVNVNLATGDNYGKVKLYIDETDCGSPIDLYSKEQGIIATTFQNCNNVPLIYGKHRFRFEVDGKNDNSSGYKIGIDWMLLDLNTKDK